MIGSTPTESKTSRTEVSPHRCKMAFAKYSAQATILLPLACSLLLFLGYPSSASAEIVGCPLIAPLSSYSPSIPFVSSSPVTSQVAAILETAISSYIANQSIPLYAVSVVHEDQMVFTSGLATTPFMLGSITKTFVALGALILRERGLLSLDDPVKKFLPNFAIINPYEPHDITLRELMGHLSGLPRELCYTLYVSGVSQAICPVKEADVLKLVAQMELVRPPWSAEPAYSNLGFAVLGHSWEKATSPRKSWDQFVVEEIIKPLGLNSTGIDLTNVQLAANDSAASLDIGWVGPAGNIYSTVTDLAKFLIFLLKAKPALISGASIREWTNSRSIFANGREGFALPWEVISINATGREFLITKGGAIATYNTIIAFHPPTQLGISILFSNNDSSLGGPDALAFELLNYLIPLVENATSGVIAPLYTGHYVCPPTPPTNSPSLNITIEVLGGFIDVTDSPSLGLSASYNYSLLIAGQLIPDIQEVALLLKNSTENSFWLGSPLDCLDFFVGVSANPSIRTPNFPGSSYFSEIAFNFANKTVTVFDPAVVCAKQ